MSDTNLLIVNLVTPDGGRIVLEVRDAVLDINEDSLIQTSASVHDEITYRVRSSVSATLTGRVESMPYVVAQPPAPPPNSDPPKPAGFPFAMRRVRIKNTVGVP